MCVASRCNVARDHVQFIAALPQHVQIFKDVQLKSWCQVPQGTLRSQLLYPYAEIRELKEPVQYKS